MSWNRGQIVDMVLARLADAGKQASDEFHLPRTVKSFTVDDLLPAGLAEAIAGSFPPVEKMVLKHHLGELKYVGVQMNEGAFSESSSGQLSRL